MGTKVHLVVATPCFGGQVSSLYAASLFRLQKALGAYDDIKLKLELEQNDALITRARANLVASFLDDPQATHLLFIDADIGFEPEQALRLISCGADVCAAIYPVKRLDWAKLRHALATDRPDPDAAALNYVLEVENKNWIVSRGDFTKVRYAGTGFLMIRRAAIELMCQRYPELNFRGDHNFADALAHSPNRFALFDCMIESETGTYLSEDFSFCRRWTEIGGEIWADLTSRLSHVGPITFRGDLATQFVRAEPAATAEAAAA